MPESLRSRADVMPEDSVCTERRAFRQHVCHVDAHDRAVKYGAKATQYNTGEVWWECRQWLPTLYEGNRDTSAITLWKTHHHTWGGFLSLAGMHINEVWLRGRRAKQAGVPDSIRRFVRDEDNCRTAALIALSCEAALEQQLSSGSNDVSELLGFDCRCDIRG